MAEQLEKIKSLSRRGKIVYIPISYLQAIFSGFMLSEPGDGVERSIEVPVIEGVPADAELVFIMACPERDAIGLKYVHESFEQVTEGHCLPEVEIEWLTFKKVKVIGRGD